MYEDYLQNRKRIAFEQREIPKIETNCLEFLCNSVIICIFANERCNYINLHKR